MPSQSMLSKNSCFKKTTIFKKAHKHTIYSGTLVLNLQLTMFSLQFIDKTHFFIRTCVERVSRVKYNRSVVSEKGSFFLLSDAKHAACVLYINTSRNRRTRTACTIWLFFSSGVFRPKNLWLKTVFTAAGVVDAGRYRVRIPLSQGHTTISTRLFRSKPPWHPTKWIRVTIFNRILCVHKRAPLPGLRRHFSPDNGRHGFYWSGFFSFFALFFIEKYPRTE